MSFDYYCDVTEAAGQLGLAGIVMVHETLLEAVFDASALHLVLRAADAAIAHWVTMPGLRSAPLRIWLRHHTQGLAPVTLLVTVRQFSDQLPNRLVLVRGDWEADDAA